MSWLGRKKKREQTTEYDPEYLSGGYAIGDFAGSGTYVVPDSLPVEPVADPEAFMEQSSTSLIDGQSDCQPVRNLEQEHIARAARVTATNRLRAKYPNVWRALLNEERRNRGLAERR